VFTSELVRGNADMLRHCNARLHERGILKRKSKYHVSLVQTPDEIRYTCDAWTSGIEQLIPERQAKG
jgi:hypothetical protein